MSGLKVGKLDEAGFCIVRDVVSADQIRDIAVAVDAITGEEYSRDGQNYAVRNLFEKLPHLDKWLSKSRIGEFVSLVLGEKYFAVSAVLFDKTPAANWKVPFHQDLTIGVRARLDAPGFGPWSVKSNSPHVQPPADVLESMLTVRLHVNDCDAGNGALRLIPGSHKLGKLHARAIQAQRAAVPEVVCEVPAGGVLLMRPLLLHASSPAITARRRRVLHFEFAAVDLPHGLEWKVRR